MGAFSGTGTYLLNLMCFSGTAFRRKSKLPVRFIVKYFVNKFIESCCAKGCVYTCLFGRRHCLNLGFITDCCSKCCLKVI